jgi:putative peptidoglycan lipid II flippase
MSTKTTGLLRSATVISSLTLLSRGLGFVRDMAIAYVLGAGARADVFFIAFHIPNLFRRLYAEGSLSLPYMPELGRACALGDEDRFKELADNLLSLAGSLYLTLVLVGLAAAPLVVSLLAPGFVHSKTHWHLAVSLTRSLLPYVLFVGMAGFAMALLNSRQHFAAPAAAPSLLNLSMLAFLGVGVWMGIPPEWALSCGVVLGGALQFGFQWPWVRGLVSLKRWSPWWRVPEAVRVFSLQVPTVLGAAVYYLNIFVATLFASFLAPGSISYLYYAERLIQFPLGIFAIAVGTSVLPELTRQGAREDWHAFRLQVVQAVELLFFLTLPAAAGLWVLREPVVHLLFQRGEFTEVSTLMTSEALGYYALGLWALAGSRVMVGAWYALGRAYIPVLTGVVALLMNLVLSALLVVPLRHGGLALATSLAAVLNVLLLLVLLAKRLRGIVGRRLLGSSARCLAASLFMALAVDALRRLAYGYGRLEGAGLALALGGWVIIGVGIYLGCVRLLGIPTGVRELWTSRRQPGSAAGEGSNPDRPSNC